VMIVRVYLVLDVLGQSTVAVGYHYTVGGRIGASYHSYRKIVIRL
jgi:hypothetical protein